MNKLGIVIKHEYLTIVKQPSFWITMIAAPKGWLWLLAGFLIFRAFDIIKPWPIRWLDRYVKGGLGIMVDDVLAGVFGLIVMQVLHYYL